MADKVGRSKREKPPMIPRELMEHLNHSQSIAKEKSSRFFKELREFNLKEFGEYVDRKDPNM